ncbi:hypothetical protein KUCAC02_021446 [Chaenocephalus aceratus]|uniref:Uncharacterized protein n=1 Tax=Chaenocephalus aceratus TaxID=36190 RepID=A0ACB9XGE5_CHAAC|nr:hypothetical protein KUCAC02_021446 [Chaenocephalus aceratus]
MNSVLTSVRSLMHTFDGKAKEFTDEIENVHMVWLEEIQQEANRMFSRDFNAEPELMPKTPSQKKSRRKRLSAGHQEENPARRRPTPPGSLNAPPRKNNNKLQTQSEVAEDVSLKPEEVQNKKPELVEVDKPELVEVDKPDYICGDAQSPPAVPSPEVAVSISASDRLSAERVKDVQLSAGRSAAKIAIAGAARSSRRSSVRHSLKVRHSLAGLRHSMTQESVRRASRRSMLKKQSQIIQIPQPSFGRITRSVAANSAAALSPFKSELSVFTPKKKTGHVLVKNAKHQMLQRKVSTKKYSPPKKSASAMRPNMKSFLHTVQKNQLLMMTPNSLGRSAVFKSFIKQNTPLKIDPKLSSRIVRQVEENKKKKLAVKRQEDLEQRKKQEEEAKTKIQQAEEEKKQQELLAKKKAEKRTANSEREEKEKALVLQRELERAAREKEKRMALEENRRLEEEQLRLAAVEVAAKEREAAAKKAAEAQKATTSLNVTVDFERSVLSTPVGKGAVLNVTVDFEKSPQSYSLTPKGRNKPTTSKTAEDYGMDQNSDDSTDDESAPRKPIPSWAAGQMLQQIIVKQYFNPPNFESFVGIIEPPKLEDIFNKKKPRYFKRTSSAVWHSPPHGRK